MDYQVEVRVYDEDDGMDYISESMQADNLGQAIRAGWRVARRLGGKIKVNVLEVRDAETMDMFCIYSKTRRVS